VTLGRLLPPPCHIGAIPIQAARLESLGINAAVYANQLIRASVRAMQDVLRPGLTELALKTGSTAG
jgi:2-methylisocitrate lyase-like PEP mutase family enzyme